MGQQTPKTENFAKRVTGSFQNQPLMAHLGVQLDQIVPGGVDLTCAHHMPITQQHGFLHGGCVSAILDSACGYAAYSLMAEDEEVLTVELKVNFLSPALGEHYRFEGRVLKPGRTLLVTQGQAFAFQEDNQKLIAIMTATMMAARGRSDIKV